MTKPTHRSSPDGSKSADLPAAMANLTSSIDQLRESMAIAADGFDAMAKENEKIGGVGRTNSESANFTVADD